MTGLGTVVPTVLESHCVKLMFLAAEGHRQAGAEVCSMGFKPSLAIGQAQCRNAGPHRVQRRRPRPSPLRRPLPTSQPQASRRTDTPGCPAADAAPGGAAAQRPRRAQAPTSGRSSPRRRARRRHTTARSPPQRRPPPSRRPPGDQVTPFPSGATGRAPRIQRNKAAPPGQSGRHPPERAARCRNATEREQAVGPSKQPCAECLVTGHRRANA